MIEIHNIYPCRLGSQSLRLDRLGGRAPGLGRLMVGRLPDRERKLVKYGAKLSGFCFVHFHNSMHIQYDKTINCVVGALVS